MKMITSSILILLLSFGAIASAQEVILDFDGDVAVDSFGTSVIDEISYIRLKYDSTIVGHKGEAALQVDTKVNASADWGGYTIFSLERDVGDFWDFSAYDTLSIMYYVLRPPKDNPINFLVLFQDNTLEDWQNGDAGEQWEYRNFDILTTDAAPGWNVLKIPLVERDGAGAGMEGSKTGLGAPYYDGTENNRKFDKDKISALMFDFQFEQNGPVDSCIIYLDHMMLIGESEVPLVFFDGRFVPSSVTMSVGWSGSTVVVNTDYFEPPGSIKWTTGDEWDGVTFTLNQTKNLVKKWAKDSLSFKIKAEAGLGDLDLLFFDPDEDADKNDYAFQAGYSLKESDMNYDGTWKKVKIALKDFDRFYGAWDDDLGDMVDGEFDSTKVNGFTIAATGQENFAGKVVYFDQIWTGNPVLDITAPNAPTIPTIATGNYFNIISWEDVPNETGEVYNIYYSESPFTSINDPGVEEVRLKVGEGLQQFTHWLTFPVNDHAVTYYYAITCVDEAGNVSDLSIYNTSVTNTAKGIPTISLEAPQNLVCDGDLTEWEHITPMIMSPSNGFLADPQYPVDDDNDMYVMAYFAVDQDYFYAAFDVTDDVFAFDETAGEWINDNIELFIGFYDWRGLKHQRFMRGDTPDYSLGFYPSNHENHGLRINVPDGGQLYNTDSTYYSFDEVTGGWVVEARIPWDSLAAAGNDPLFVPEEGMRIALDMTAHDSDTPGSLDGMLALSRYNKDTSFQNPKDWTFTWIGNKAVTTGIAVSDNNVPVEFDLQQNYPNPFNPTTNIQYSVDKNSRVELNIYNSLGQLVCTLVNKLQPSGKYSVQWHGQDSNGVTVASGIYIYQLKSGDKLLRRKLMLLK